MRSIRDVLIVISLALVTIQTIHPMTHPGDAGAGDQLSPVSGCQPGSGPSPHIHVLSTAKSENCGN